MEILPHLIQIPPIKSNGVRVVYHMNNNPFQIFKHFYYKWDQVLIGNTMVHSHAQYEIYYFHGGRCTYVLGERAIPLQPGDLIFMNGLTPHRPQVDPSAAYIRTMFSFDPHVIQVFGNSLLACNPLKPFETLRNHHLRLNPDARAECENILERINRFYSSDDILHHNRMLAAFYDLLMFICEQCRHEITNAPHALTNSERYVQQIVTYIETHYMQDISVDDMAGDLHLNRHHLMKVFREVTGMTISDYLFKRRIDQAKTLFYRNTRISVADIGYQVGFKHPSHFSRTFKKLVGISPERYRKTILESVHHRYPDKDTPVLK